MTISAEHRSKFADLHRQWWRLQMSEKSGRNSKQTDNLVSSRDLQQIKLAVTQIQDLGFWGLIHRTAIFDILSPILPWIPLYIWSIACFILSSLTSTQYPVFPTQDPLLPVLRCSNSFRVVALSVGSEFNFVTWSFMYNLRKYNLYIFIYLYIFYRRYMAEIL